MQIREKLAEEQQLRNTLSIRWRDGEHQAVTEIAWKRRTSASAMIREIVLSALEDEMKGGLQK